MPKARPKPTAPTEVAILGRVLSNGAEGLPASLARYLLSVGFSEADEVRMLELAARNQGGDLSSEEREELLGYARAGCLLGVLQSIARKALKRSKKSRTP
jgi:hypothetical protein